MKKISLLISVLLLLTLMLTLIPAAASAEADGILTVDQSAIAEANSTDANKTYGKGYMPAKNAGQSIDIVLPLTTDKLADIKSDVIVAPAVTAEDKALEPSNVMVKFDKPAQADTEWKKTAVFTLKIKPSCYDGVYPVSFIASYSRTDPADATAEVSAQQTFVIYMRVTGNPEPTPTPEPTQPSAETAGPVSLPKLMVTGYTISPNTVEAGGEMNLSLTIKNMSKKRAAVNIELTLSSDGAVFLPKGGTNSAYIDKLKGGDETSLSFDFDVKPDAEPAPASITVDIKYEDTAVNQASASSVISIPVNQPIRVRFTDATANGSTSDSPFSVSVNMINMGKSTVYNVSAELTGDSFYQQTSYFGGNIAPGEQKQIELTAYAQMQSIDEGMPGEGSADIPNGSEAAMSTMVMSSDGAAMSVSYDGDMGGGMGQSQDFSGEVTISYEDVNGKQFTEVKPFTVSMQQYIEEPIIDDPSFYPEEEPASGGSLWWLWVLIAVLVVGGVVVLLVVRSKKRKKAIEDELL